MKNYPKHKTRNSIVGIFIALLIIEAGTSLFAYNLRQFSSKNGLSNSAILSLCQDRHGVIWIGSCDGLNVYDDTYLGLYKPIDNSICFSGNLIEKIIEGDNDVLWIQTNYGLDRFDVRRQDVQSFYDFKYVNRMTRSTKNDLFAIKDDGYIYYYHDKLHDFQKVYTEKFASEDVQELAVDNFGVLWVFFANASHRSYVIEKNGEEIELHPCSYLTHDRQLQWSFVDGDAIYFVDNSYKFYEFDLKTTEKRYITEIGEIVRKKGDISSINTSVNFTEKLKVKQ